MALDCVTYEVTILASSEKAVKCDFGDGVILWVPKSQLHEDSEVGWSSETCSPGTQGDIVIPLWLAEKNGLST